MSLSIRSSSRSISLSLLPLPLPPLPPLLFRFLLPLPLPPLLFRFLLPLPLPPLPSLLFRFLLPLPLPPLFFRCCSSSSSLSSSSSSFLFLRLLLLPLLLCLLPTSFCSSFGSTTAQCPDGHFLSRFSSAFDGNERFYKFSCAKFHGGWTAAILEEKCEATEMTRMDDGGDAYLSCGSEKYTAGVRVVDGALSVGDHHQQTAEWWQLLCCQSDYVRVRAEDCVETKFINDFRRSSSFSSGAQVIRRWQAMFENGDRRWWLQICPVDVALPLKKHKIRLDGAEVRARREIPLEWRRSRFPTTSIQHFHHYTFADENMAADFRRRRTEIANAKVNSYAVPTVNVEENGKRQIMTTTIGKKSESATTARRNGTSTEHQPQKVTVAEKEEEEGEETVTESKVSRPSPRQIEILAAEQRRQSRLFQFNERIRTRNEQKMSTKTTTEETRAKGKARKNGGGATEGQTKGQTDALDYYDMLALSFLRAFPKTERTS
ncbi:hypothetical protein niasHT_035147 [Heterodera trifolii]|uniref:Uncharacterized protein n=1 Tax=Heterodera trifolii TaxID=157864 RepID=A0ABD2IYC1_9BILA